MIFNLGGIASSYSSIVQKPSTMQIIGKGLSDFEKTYKQYPPINSTSNLAPVNYTASPVKKSNTTILLIGGGIAVVMAIMLFK